METILFCNVIVLSLRVMLILEFWRSDYFRMFLLGLIDEFPGCCRRLLEVVRELFL